MRAIGIPRQLRLRRGYRDWIVDAVSGKNVASEGSYMGLEVFWKVNKGKRASG